MNILFDTSVLGAGNFNVRAQTGIFRVVYNLARGLAADPRVNMTFCAPASFVLLLETIKFHEADGILRQHAFAVPDYRYFSSVRCGIEALQRCIARHERIYGRTALSSKLLRTARMLTNRALTALQALDSDLLLDKKYLNTADIYHSPFHPFPSHLRQDAPHLIRFITIHDLIPIKFPHFFAFDEQQILRKNLAAIDQRDWILCVSQSTKNDLLEYRPDLDPEKIFVVYLGCSSHFYPCTDTERRKAVRLKYGIPLHAIYFLSLSTLEPRKNIGAIIQAFARLQEQERNKSLFLVLAGPKGWDYSTIFTERKRFPALNKQIILPGFIDEQDMAPLYSDALAFIYPSLYEGFGLPLLEAMQCGTPVITSNTSSMPEVVGDAGITIDPVDVDSLAEKMLDIYSRPELVKILSEKSRKQASLFSWDKCVEQTINTYMRAIDR